MVESDYDLNSLNQMVQKDQERGYKPNENAEIKSIEEEEALKRLRALRKAGFTITGRIEAIAYAKDVLKEKEYIQQFIKYREAEIESLEKGIPKIMNESGISTKEAMQEIEKKIADNKIVIETLMPSVKACDFIIENEKKD